MAIGSFFMKPSYLSIDLFYCLYWFIYFVRSLIPVIHSFIRWLIIYLSVCASLSFYDISNSLTVTKL